ncbi:MAG: UDP-2,3-diacylglucosamine diphosphatase [Planctomycetes bacterium]|nr:UDP-2,3-diacylglucosamine diphosphatase [Planctomycetota bacterium]MCW8136102.1 UDP-2,3-diacylglucosamine diphosphatase [Planctomycetota bacterium]
MAEFDGVLFSDLHLSPELPELTALFDAFVDRVAGTPSVACLGDLTEYWIGRQHLLQPFGRHVYDQMKRLSDGARDAIFVPGNRDFLFSAQARQAGWRVFANRFEGDFCGTRVAFEHGDRFCTEDRQYQRFRMWFRRLPWRLLEMLINEERGHRLARNLRSRSKGHVARKNPSAFGIQRRPVERLVFRGAKVIVCGHVHTPFSRNYQGAKDIGRLHVMSDWRDDGAIVCTVKDGKFELTRFTRNGFEPFDAPSEQKTYAAAEAAAEPE